MRTRESPPVRHRIPPPRHSTRTTSSSIATASMVAEGSCSASSCRLRPVRRATLTGQAFIRWWSGLDLLAVKRGLIGSGRPDCDRGRGLVLRQRPGRVSCSTSIGSTARGQRPRTIRQRAHRGRKHGLRLEQLPLAGPRQPVVAGVIASSGDLKRYATTFALPVRSVRLTASARVTEARLRRRYTEHQFSSLRWHLERHAELTEKQAKADLDEFVIATDERSPRSVAEKTLSLLGLG